MQGGCQQIAAADFGGIHSNFRSEFVQLRFESEANVHRAVAAHSAAGGLVREHAVSVILNVRNVVERAQQRAGIQNRDYAVRTVSAAILHYAGFNGHDAPVILDAGLKVDDGARTTAMGPEDFFARVGNLDRSFAPCGPRRPR